MNTIEVFSLFMIYPFWRPIILSHGYILIIIKYIFECVSLLLYCYWG